MDLINLLLISIEKISESEFKYKLINLDSLKPFEITDIWITGEYVPKARASNFLKDILADNQKTVSNEIDITINRLCPLYFKGVFLNKNPMTASDIAIIPDVTARGLNKIANSMSNLI